MQYDATEPSSVELKSVVLVVQSCIKGTFQTKGKD